MYQFFQLLMVQEKEAFHWSLSHKVLTCEVRSLTSLTFSSYTGAEE